MPILLDEFRKGIKPMDKESLEYKLLEFLKREKSAYTIDEIMKAFNLTQNKFKEDNYKIYFDYRLALIDLSFNEKIDMKSIKTEGKSEYTTYYMAK